MQDNDKAHSTHYYENRAARVFSAMLARLRMDTAIDAFTPLTPPLRADFGGSEHEGTATLYEVGAPREVSDGKR